MPMFTYHHTYSSRYPGDWVWEICHFVMFHWFFSYLIPVKCEVGDHAVWILMYCLCYIDLLNYYHMNHNHIPNNQAWILCAVRGHIPMLDFFTQILRIFYTTIHWYIYAVTGHVPMFNYLHRNHNNIHVVWGDFPLFN